MLKKVIKKLTGELDCLFCDTYDLIINVLFAALSTFNHNITDKKL